MSDRPQVYYHNSDGDMDEVEDLAGWPRSSLYIKLDDHEAAVEEAERKPRRRPTKAERQADVDAALKDLGATGLIPVSEDAAEVAGWLRNMAVAIERGAVIAADIQWAGGREVKAKIRIPPAPPTSIVLETEISKADAKPHP